MTTCVVIIGADYFNLLVSHNSKAQPKMPSREMVVMKIGQKLFVKSLILFSFGFLNSSDQ